MKVKLNFNKCKSIEDLHNILMKKFKFPEYYGKNLDALYDCLTEKNCEYDVEVFYRSGGELEDYVFEIIDVLKEVDTVECIHIFNK